MYSRHPQASPELEVNPSSLDTLWVVTTQSVHISLLISIHLCSVLIRFLHMYMYKQTRLFLIVVPSNE